MPPRRVSEASPIQVYLGPEEQERLAALARRLDTTKSDIVRRGLLALEREVADPEDHPLLRAIGMFEEATPHPESTLDPARDHDQVLADAEVRSWSEPRASPSEKPARRRRGR